MVATEHGKKEVDLPLMESKKKLLVITGPTASGKTSVAIEVASRLKGEIISADSMLVYKGMDIGTDKPSAGELSKIKHHMIDVVKPDEEFNAAIYKSMVEDIINDISSRGLLPVMAGGTGLYIKSVVDNYSFKGAGNNPGLRRSLREELNLKGAEYLHNQLLAADPETAGKLHPNDTRRIIRALEIINKSGIPLSGLAGRNKNTQKYNVAMFGLHQERAVLYKKINGRVDEMLNRGLVEEVRGLLLKGYGTGLVSMKGLGYKEVAAYLEGDISLDEAVYLLKRNTRRFAKRQLTWFKREHRIKWIDVGKHTDVHSIAGEIITDIKGLLPVS